MFASSSHGRQFIPPVPVRYAGLDGTSDRRLFALPAGELLIFRVKAGDLVSLRDLDGGGSVLIASLTDDARQPDLSALDGLEEDVSEALFGTEGLERLGAYAGGARLLGILSARGGDAAMAQGLRVFDGLGDPGDQHLCRVKRDCLFIAHAPMQPQWLRHGGGGRFEVEHRAGPKRKDALLPEPLGRVVDEFRVDRASARAYEIKMGQFVQVIDVQGRQCSDFMAMRADALDAGLERHIDGTVTRTMARGAYPRPGLHDKFFDQDIKPLLALRHDTVGRHDTFALACTARGYEERGFPGHVNCSDNISHAYQPFGIGARPAWPAVNFFFNSWIDGDAGGGTQAMGADEAWSCAGDYVALEALTDLVCVSTACPDDVDPINGWDPTDIHVRIYDNNAPIFAAVTHRWRPDAAATMTRQSPFHSRTSRLTSSFHVAQDVWSPSHYDATGVLEEYWACRERATLQDMSSLRKFDIIGPDAEALLQLAMTRNVSRLAIYRGLYALICDEAGQVIDDGTLFRLEDKVFRWCCGSDGSGTWLQDLAKAYGLRVHVRALSEAMANLALQGPASRDILRSVVFTQPARPALENVRWFGFTQARLHDRDGLPFMLTRTGFTGELGYELFCSAADAPALWDGLMKAGAEHSLTPMGGDALGIVRIEAGLMAAGAEFDADVDALEAGLGFAVDMKKDHFIGRDALERNGADPRRKLVGLHVNCDEPLDHGDVVFMGERPVGVVTSACRSPSLNHTIAMARLAREYAGDGLELEVGRLDGRMKRLACRVTSVPFMDAKREKPRV